MAKQKRQRRKRSRAAALTSGEFEKMLSVIRSESDRGCVLCVAALIEMTLELALRERFKLDSGVSDDFLDILFIREPAPLLGSSAAKALIATARGIISANFKQGLDALRHVRNEAAHMAQDFALDSDAIDGVQACLTEREKKWVELCVRRRHRKNRNRARDRFMATAFCLYVRVGTLAALPQANRDAIDNGGMMSEILSFEAYDQLL